jgi:hypothetical protein
MGEEWGSSRRCWFPIETLRNWPFRDEVADNEGGNRRFERLPIVVKVGPRVEKNLLLELLLFLLLASLNFKAMVGDIL